MLDVLGLVGIDVKSIQVFLRRFTVNIRDGDEDSIVSSAEIKAT